MKLSIAIFDELTTLDAIGGYEVLSRLRGIEIAFIAEQRPAGHPRQRVPWLCSNHPNPSPA